MKQPNNIEESLQLHDRLSAAELRSMAMRQQQQIDTQHQLLTAKEQRLRFLKSQESRNAVSVTEGERLRRLRERVEAQESKLRRLRALRGQADLQKTYNVTLGNDLDSIRALFSEKEKELTLAVAKVEALTRQLEELRRDRRGGGVPFINHGAAHNSLTTRELEKLRLELAYRNQLSLQQNTRLNIQREALQQKQVELHSVDKRIIELQSRINKKKIMNVQQYKVTPNATHATVVAHPNPLHARTASSSQLHQQPRNVVGRGNVVAVEPFNHVPVKCLPMTTGNGNGGNQGNNGGIMNDKLQQSNLHDMMVMGTPSPVGSEQQQPDLMGSGMNGGLAKLKEAAIMLEPESDEKKLARQRQQQQQQLQQDYRLLHNNAHLMAGSVKAKEDSDAKGPKKYPLKDSGNVGTPGLYYEGANTMMELAMGKIDVRHQPSASDDTTYGFGPVMPDHEYDHGGGKTIDIPDTTGKLKQPSPQWITTSTEDSHMPQKKSKPSATDGKSPLMKSSYNYLQNIPLGNLVVPPRKPINSVAPTFSLKTTTQASSPAGIMTNDAKKPSPHTDGGDAGDQLKPALPPKPNKVAPGSREDSGSTVDIGSDFEPPNAGYNEGTGVGAMSSIMASGKGGGGTVGNDNLPIKAKPLTIKKQPLSEQPKLKSISSSNSSNNNNNNNNNSNNNNINISYNSKLLLQSVQNFPIKKKEALSLSSSNSGGSREPVETSGCNELLMSGGKEPHEYYEGNENINSNNATLAPQSDNNNGEQSQTAGIGPGYIKKGKEVEEVSRRKRNFAGSSTPADGKHKLSRRVSFDPLALLLDASLEGELELVEKTAMQVTNPSAANDEGITALHNAICAGHFEIVKFLVNFGCDVNAQDSDGWTPLHCAASCNNLPMVKFLVESGACLFAATLSDHETPAEKCEEDEEGFDGCSEYLYSIQEKLGILNTGEVFAVFSYESQQQDELSFCVNDKLTIIRKGDEAEREWWWAKDATTGQEGYVPRNLLGLHPRLAPMCVEDIN